MANELISVIVPCYNVGAYLDETLESVLNQSYENWECIVVNDGSPDNTAEVGLKWEQKDKRFIYLELENGGVERARNKGIEIAKGEFILPLDGDDKLAPTFLEKTLKVFTDAPDTMLVYCLVEQFGDKQGILHMKDFNLHNLAVLNMIVCTALYRKSEWVRTGGYDEKVKYHLEDWEFWINMLKDGGTVVRIDEPLFFYRIRPFSGIRSVNEEKLKYMRRYISTKHAAFYQEYVGDIISVYWEREYIKDAIADLTLRRRLKKFSRSPVTSIKKAMREIING
ncbi:glycosyltransferase family 2 protein [Flavitalea sp.]|nr:glycosyltransferase family A protein [Flavitalea sp.]